MQLTLRKKDTLTKIGWVFKMFSEVTKEWMQENDYDILDIDRVGKHGNSALMKAVREARDDIASELIEAGAALDIENIDGNSALWNACFSQSYRCVELLVDAGIDLNSLNDNGVSALMYSSSAGKDDMVKLLLAHGADKELINLDGFKAVDLAVTPRIYKMLK